MIVFDLNDSGDVDVGDHTEWVTEVMYTWFGDADLDGRFNSGDLVRVFASGEYEDDLSLNSGWVDGDWDTEGDFTTSDLVLAFQDGGYEAGPRTGVAAVPEPSGLVLLTLSPCGLLFGVASRSIRCRRRAYADSKLEADSSSSQRFYIG